MCRLVTAPTRRVGAKEEDFGGVRLRRKFWGASQGRDTSEYIKACLSSAQNDTTIVTSCGETDPMSKLSIPGLRKQQLPHTTCRTVFQGWTLINNRAGKVKSIIQAATSRRDSATSAAGRTINNNHPSESTQRTHKRIVISELGHERGERAQELFPWTV